MRDLGLAGRAEASLCEERGLLLLLARLQRLCAGDKSARGVGLHLCLGTERLDALACRLLGLRLEARGELDVVVDALEARGELVVSRLRGLGCARVSIQRGLRSFGLASLIEDQLGDGRQRQREQANGRSRRASDDAEHLEASADLANVREIRNAACDVT